MGNNDYSKSYYDNDLREIICSNCNVLFIGKRNRKTCSKECTKISKLKGMEVHHHITKCSDCNLIIKDIIKYGKKANDILKIKRCVECSKKHRINYYKNRNNLILENKKNNPEFITIKTKSGIFYYNKNKYDAIVHNMCFNNPMFSEEIKNKTFESKLRNITNGDTVYKKGKEHHLWRGNRHNNQIIRSRLYPWRKEIQIKYKWKCQICKSNKNLEVHHIEPLREIIDKFINKPLSEYDNESVEFENLIEHVINYHNNNHHVGVLLCEICHANVDKYRKQTLKRDNENKKRVLYW